MEDARDDLVVYTLGWQGDAPIEAGEKPTAQIHGRVFVNGTEIETAAVTIEPLQQDFLRATIVFNPGTVRIVPLSDEQFREKDLSAVVDADRSLL